MLGNASKIFRRKVATPPLEVRVEGIPGVRVFTSNFQLGRDEACELQIDSSCASRAHAEVRFENGTWVLKDLESTNGTYVGDRQIDEVPIGRETTVRLGTDGPLLTFTSAAHGAKASVGERGEVADSRDKPKARLATPANDRQRTKSDRQPTMDDHRRSASDQDLAANDQESAARNRQRRADDLLRRANARSGSVSRPQEPSGRRPRASREVPLSSTREFVEHYFSSGHDDEAAGERTRMIRRAYAQVEKQHRRRHILLALAAASVCLVAVGFAAWQYWQADQIENAFIDLRAQDAEIARIRMALEERHDTELAAELERLEEERARRRSRFEGYVEEYGLRRDLTAEERVIFKVARIFNESHTSMPATFVRAVREQIRVWQTTGRSTLVGAIQRAEEEGYTREIARAMREHDLPAEFFYLALVESGFRPEAVGPPTRFGYAKGMWQFIQETGLAYGLQPGPRADDNVYDPYDDRHDSGRSTVAAARYLRDIYGTLAHASGLLAMASYNWGEHRVVGKLGQLMEDIPDDPQARSYWRFYNEYSDRMPQETKDYVIKIFAAAVIGENPRLFGFDFDNPLESQL